MFDMTEKDINDTTYFFDEIDFDLLVERICKKYKIKRNSVRYDLKYNGNVNFNQKEIENDLGRITKPDDDRGYWNCYYVNVVNLSPLILQIDGCEIIPY